jgi:hypothetical protein
MAPALQLDLVPAISTWNRKSAVYIEKMVDYCIYLLEVVLYLLEIMLRDNQSFRNLYYHIGGVHLTGYIRDVRLNYPNGT